MVGRDRHVSHLKFMAFRIFSAPSAPHPQSPLLTTTLFSTHPPHTHIRQALVEAIASRGQYRRDLAIVNTDRSVGARVSGEVAKRWGNKGFAAEGGRLSFTFRGSAGQSFGAFGLPGMRMEVVGEVNDYAGKGLHGGEIVIRPPEDALAGCGG